jgi:hypothetical protein
LYKFQKGVILPNFSRFSAVFPLETTTCATALFPAAQDIEKHLKLCYSHAATP